MATKATVNVGEYSRGGRSRGQEPVKALDHDMQPKEKLVPGGILEPVNGKAFLFFAGSYKTSDFLVDGFHLWWNERKENLSHIKNLVVNMDNGPECNARRSQFLLRMTELADMTGLSQSASSTTRLTIASTMELSATGRGWKSHGTVTCLIQ